ncbi:MAG: hypothetical protein RLZZ387_3576 [Chloroflexota bacterium]|jgi:hypothetical protein
MKQIPSKKIDTTGLRRALTTLAVAAGLAGWAALARPEDGTASIAPAAQVAVAQTPVLAAGTTAQAPVALASAPRLRVVTAPAPVTSTRSSR